MSQHQKVTAQQTLAGRPCAGTRTEKWARLLEAPRGTLAPATAGVGLLRVVRRPHLPLRLPSLHLRTISDHSPVPPSLCRDLTARLCPRTHSPASPATAPPVPKPTQSHHLPVRSPHSWAWLRVRPACSEPAARVGRPGGPPTPPSPTLVPPHLRSFCCSGPQASLGLPKQNPHPHRLLLILGTPEVGGGPNSSRLTGSGAHQSSRK